jgi:hypothetical protein
MGITDRKSDRGRKAKAYRDLVRRLRGLSDIHRATPRGIFDCLSKARLSEKSAISCMLAREVLLQEGTEVSLPEDLSDQVIAEHFAGAARLWADAGTDCVMIGYLSQSYRCFQKAARLARAAAKLLVQRDAELLHMSREFRDKAVMVRQESARKSILRKKLSLGFLKRRR